MKNRAAQRPSARIRAFHAVADQRLLQDDPVEIPTNWVSVALGIALIPVLAGTVSAFSQSLAQAALEHAFWKSAEFWFFSLGALLWLISFVGLRGPVMVYLYVFGHEWTHALFAVGTGGKLLRRPLITSRGGEVVTDRSNLLINLAPYFFPFYSVVVGIAFGIVGFFQPLSSGALWSLYGLLGFTWAFHLTFTLWMMRHRQPDFEENGRFFSITLVLLCNLLVLALLLVAASPQLSLTSFVRLWLEQAWESFSGIGRVLMGA